MINPSMNPRFNMPSYMPQSYASLFSAYHSFSATIMLLRTIINEIIRHIPKPIRRYISLLFFRLFKFRFSTNLTMTIHQYTNSTINQVFESAELYLQSKISPETNCLRLSKTPRETKPSVSIDKDQQTIDTFENIPLKWSYFREEKPSLRGNKFEGEKCYYVLEFPLVHKDKVMEFYIPYVFAQAEAIKAAQKVIKIYSRSMRSSYDTAINWGSTNLEHPATFETLAMEPELKKTIVEDMDRFLRRKEFYKKVGKAWKRGYLLYGPPGTGKSSLIAAMANYLKFDIYDLELTSVLNNADLKKILLSTTNRSILVIEDIDCSVNVQNREKESESSDSDSAADEVTNPKSKFTLSGLLNFTDGLWSSCGDERIIVFTTNHKERLDPALLRPGRMDKHIHMSYCTPSGFKVLASNYLGIGDENRHPLCEEIEELIASTEVTPAEVAEELMKSDDADVALEALVDFIKCKKVESEERQEAEAKRRERRRSRKEKKENGDENEKVAELRKEVKKLKQEKTRLLRATSGRLPGSPCY